MAVRFITSLPTATQRTELFTEFLLLAAHLENLLKMLMILVRFRLMEQEFYYVRYGEKMQLLSANASDGGDEREILSTDSRQIYRDPQFSVDGDKIFFIKFEPINGEEYWSLIEIPSTGGEERVIIPLRKPKISEIAVLKDKSGLLVNAVDPVSNLSQIYYVSISDGKERRITNDLNTYFGISVSDDVKTIVYSPETFCQQYFHFRRRRDNSRK